MKKQNTFARRQGTRLVKSLSQELRSGNGKGKQHSSWRMIYSGATMVVCSAALLISTSCKAIQERARNNADDISPKALEARIQRSLKTSNQPGFQAHLRLLGSKDDGNTLHIETTVINKGKEPIEVQKIRGKLTISFLGFQSFDDWRNNRDYIPGARGQAFVEQYLFKSLHRSSDGKKDSRVLRGRSWVDFKRRMECSTRHYFDPAKHYHKFGFRLLLAR